MSDEDAARPKRKRNDRGTATVGARRERVRPEPRQHRVYERRIVEFVPGELRVMSERPESLPPCPCRLCAKNFATRDLWKQHVVREHCGADEYRKCLFWYLSSWDCVQSVTPQEWRHIVRPSPKRWRLDLLPGQPVLLMLLHSVTGPLRVVIPSA